MTTLHEPRRSHAVSPVSEAHPRPLPKQLLNVIKQRRIATQRRKLLEQQRLIQAFAEHGGRKRLDGAVLIQQARCSDGPGFCVAELSPEVLAAVRSQVPCLAHRRL